MQDEAQEVSEGLARIIYADIATYAFDEPECWPRQELIAEDVGVRRETVNRAIQQLIRAGWLRIKEKRRSVLNGWDHNVYELLEAYQVSDLAAKRITRRAHRRGRRRAREERFARLLLRGEKLPDHTNDVGRADGGGRPCRCRSCRVDRASIRCLPPPIRPPTWRDRVERFRWHLEHTWR